MGNQMTILNDKPIQTSHTPKELPSRHLDCKASMLCSYHARGNELGGVSFVSNLLSIHLKSRLGLGPLLGEPGPRDFFCRILKQANWE